jgi:hypothetical protein
MSKSSKDSPFPLDLVETQSRFTKWILSCDTHEQLIILNSIVPDFFTEKRFPSETSNALFLAKTALLLDIQTRIEDLTRGTAVVFARRQDKFHSVKTIY